ncbi:hypothetical protein AQUCO_00200975v1 [Aquilegia coerulea]|uniref:Uncharacterized protein n=1 Tax=Aquilegia coerulea TaxID=218851 RepID=A0A2G5F5M9_AQUCA|nr:hypothetical protein AQUCO_00200975v1 [Aquilegia coerulea]
MRFQQLHQCYPPFSVVSIISERSFAHDLPISTHGPSGPSEQPVPKVTAAWMALIVGKTPENKSNPCAGETLDCFIWTII